MDNKSKLSLIKSDLEAKSKILMSDGNVEATSCQASSPEEPSKRKSIFAMKSANQTVSDALKKPDPIPLYGSWWFEGELCCLFADSNLGKSILAVQMADDIASKRKEPVIYFDFEMSDKQFQMRYTDDETGEVHQFPDNFFRTEIDPDALLGDNFEDDIINGIEEIVSETGCKIAIIDNLSFLCNKSEKGDCAGILMVRLKALRDKYDLSLLILAHTPKRDLTRPITQNDLAGSKRLFNFFRSSFVIGKSAKDEALRYVKQIKVTSVIRDLEYLTDGRVNVYSVKQVNGMVRFCLIGSGLEKDHLRGKDEITDEVLAKAKKMQSEGKSYSEIAEALNVNRSTLYYKLKK